MTIEYPYAIESDSGGTWLYHDNDSGKMFLDGRFADEVGPSCTTLLTAIRNEHPWWPAGSCIYAGPAKPEHLAMEANQ